MGNLLKITKWTEIGLGNGMFAVHDVSIPKNFLIIHKEEIASDLFLLLSSE